MSSNQNLQALLYRLGAALPAYERATAEFDRMAAAVTGLHTTDLHCIEQLRFGPLTAGQLATAAGLTRGATTTLIDRLVTAGYVERRPDPDDRRSIRIALTPLAEGWIDRIWGPLAAEGAAMAAGFGEADLAVVVRFLEEGTALQKRHAARVAGLKGPSPG